MKVDWTNCLATEYSRENALQWKQAKVAAGMWQNMSLRTYLMGRDIAYYSIEAAALSENFPYQTLRYS